MIAQYQGLNVTELDELRKELRDKGILFKITKNRITKIAIKETPVKDLEKYFTGPTAAAISSDPITTAKILTKFAKSHDKVKNCCWIYGRQGFRPKRGGYNRHITFT
jgi:large subunit ribosomal protein L10